MACAKVDCAISWPKPGATGVVRSRTLEGGWPLMPGTLMFRRSGQQQGLALARPASPTFRCGHCGGPLFVDDFDIVLLRSEKLEEIEDRPRRGRPPKRPR